MLLISHAFDERGIASADLYRKLMFDKLEVNEGMLVENIVAQMLRTAGHKLYFFSNSSRTSAYHFHAMRAYPLFGGCKSSNGISNIPFSFLNPLFFAFFVFSAFHHLTP